MSALTEQLASAGPVDGHRPASIVRAVGVTRAFGGQQVLDGLDLTIAAGEIVALLGRSGSGKSTLLKALAGLDSETGGTLEVNGGVSVAFQDARLLPWLKVADNVVIGLRHGDSPHDLKSQARQALAEVGLQDKEAAWPLTLSGGEAQRVSLARALVREPDLLLLDEPFGALDALTRITMHKLMLTLWERHRPAILLVTHDVDEALILADRIVLLADRKIGYEQAIEVPRPRDRDHHALTETRRRLLVELGVQD